MTVTVFFIPVPSSLCVTGSVQAAHAEQDLRETGADPCGLPCRERVHQRGGRAQPLQPQQHILLVSDPYMEGTQYLEMSCFPEGVFRHFVVGIAVQFPPGMGLAAARGGNCCSKRWELLQQEVGIAAARDGNCCSKSWKLLKKNHYFVKNTSLLYSKKKFGMFHFDVLYIFFYSINLL